MLCICLSDATVLFVILTIIVCILHCGEEKKNYIYGVLLLPFGFYLCDQDRALIECPFAVLKVQLVQFRHWTLKANGLARGLHDRMASRRVFS